MKEIASFFNRDQSVSAEEALRQRQKIVLNDWTLKNFSFSNLFQTKMDIDRVSKTNCENLLGSVEIPVGVAGPVSYISNDQEKTALLPLASSEAALIASTNRGVKAINQMGGALVFSERIGMSRGPVFAFKNGQAALDFKKFVHSKENLIQIKKITESTSSYLEFKDLKSWVRGRKVFLRFVFDTDQAMGMNMITIAIKELWDLFLSNYDGIEMLSISGNLCVDKKDSVINRLLGRGDSAHAEVFLSKEVIEKTLKTSAEKIFKTHLAKNLVGSSLAGSFSQNMQAANIVAAFFLATGQDMAHVVEGSQVTTSIELEEDGLYVAVDMPNINIATVGGGTWLEAQKDARDLISQDKNLSSIDLAEILAVAVLAAEISGIAALSNGTLTKAHQDLARSNVIAKNGKKND